jgi:hypothetical protein
MKWFNGICSAFAEHSKLVQKIAKNKQSSEQLGWKPSWFGPDVFDRKLVQKIEEYQLKFEELEATGVVDDMTYRRKMTGREGLAIVLKDYAERHRISPQVIICDGKPVEIEWNKVVLFQEIDGLALPSKCYRTSHTLRKPHMFVVHWDVCLNSKSCFNVLKKREISVHFCIDNDGTIYQLMDCNNIAWHSGNRKVNNNSVGVEISNAYYPKYQGIYKTKGFGDRPIWSGVEVHGRKLEPFLGFYDVQLDALKALTKALNKAYEIPLVAPMDGEKLITTTESSVQNGTFKGVVNHYHIIERKIDCAGLKLDKILEEIT